MQNFQSQEQQRLARVSDEILRHPDWSRATHEDFDHKQVALFIHGFTADAKYMHNLMHQFEGAGFRSLAFNYESFSGIDHAAKSLYALLNGFNRSNSITSNKIVLVAHSMGGLVARALIYLEDGCRFVRKVITLGTPHRGTLTDENYLKKLLQWGEKISGLNPRGFTPTCRSALQLLRKDNEPMLLDRLNEALPSECNVEFLSVSGGYAKLEFGSNVIKNAMANKYLQNKLKKPNDGLVEESSSNIIQSVPSLQITGLAYHENSYPTYEQTNHSNLINNQTIALAAINFSWEAQAD